jgi:2-keto-4-pentenoate hydratase/2-oxohepta-3-ene-1,7-dioic acid hydratase in catechol pathway
VSEDNIRLGRFQVRDRVVIGCVENDELSIVHDGDALPAVLASGIPASLSRIPLHEAVMLPPIDPSARVFAVAINYRAHGVESAAKPPERPLIFYKAPSNFVAHGGELNPNRDVTAKLDYEGEIAVVIGRQCKAVAPEDALKYVGGICAFNDGSARDLVKLSAGDSFWPDWTAAKALDGASALGPTITCGKAVIDSLNRRTLTISTRLNGELVQDGAMADMIFSTEQIIATLSSYMTLLPGDVIATGTPAGVGATSNRYLKTGDVLDIEISGIDALRVRVG